MKQLFIGALMLIVFNISVLRLHAQQTTHNNNKPVKGRTEISYRSWKLNDSLNNAGKYIDTAKLIYQYHKLRFNNNNSVPVKPPEGIEYYYLKGGCLFYTED